MPSISIDSVHVRGTHSENQLRILGEEARDYLGAHESFLQDHGISSTSTQPLTITLLSNADEFKILKAQSKARSESARGFYEYRQKEIVTWETLTSGFSSEVRRILVHETFHHQMHNALGDQIPLWLNEGLGVLFENSTFVRGMRLDCQGTHQAAKSQVRAALANNTLIPLRDLLQMDRNAFYYGDTAKNYAHAWSLVHFLLNDPVQKNRRTMEKILKAVKNGQNPQDILLEANANDLKRLEENWHQYISRL